MLIVGAPLRQPGRLYNTAVVIHRGQVLGVVPKMHLPNYREFYEKRQFASGRGSTGLAIIRFAGRPRRSAPTCCSRRRTSRA